MTLPTIKRITKVATTGLWFCLCLVTFWGDPSRVFFFGVLFGMTIWYGADKADQRVSPRANAMITGSILLVLIVLILVLKLGAYPIVTAIIALAFGIALTYYKFLAQADTPKNVEQGGDGDAEEAV